MTSTDVAIFHPHTNEDVGVKVCVPWFCIPDLQQRVPVLTEGAESP